MSAPVLDQSYLDNVCESLPPDHPLRSNNNRLNSPQHQRVIYTCLYGSTTVTTVKHSIPQLIQHHRDTEACNQVAICLIENICQEWIIALGTAWNIDHSFFSRHASNPGGVSIWDAVMYPGGKWKSWSQNDNTAPTSAHVIGCFEHLKEDQSRPQRDRFPRRLQDHPLWGLHGTSNVSYWRVSPCLYLILTDLPFAICPDDRVRDKHFLTHLYFRVPFSGNRGGLAISQHYNRIEFSALDIFVTFLSHTWHWRLLFADHLESSAIHPGILSNLLAASMWRTNFQCLKREIESIAFKDVRRPSILINDRLHDARQKLGGLQAEVRFARKYLRMDDLDAFFQHVQYSRPNAPRDALAQVLEESEHLYQFLMDTFQLLMSSITIIDSQTSLEEAKRSTSLTQLAAVYLPLSLATSIFGMNIKEINGSPLSVWVVFVALGILGLGTVVLLLGATPIRAASLRELRTWAKYLPQSKKNVAIHRAKALEEPAVELPKYD